MRNKLSKSSTFQAKLNTNIIVPIEMLLQKPMPILQIPITVSNNACSICLQIPENEIVAQIKDCQHQFHINCLRKWYQISEYCPLCKGKI